MSKELFRNEMIEAAAGLNAAAVSKIEARVRTDRALALEYRLLSLFQFAGIVRLAQAPKALLAKVNSLPQVTGARKLEQISSGIREILGAVAFDSWVMPQPVGVRGSAGAAGAAGAGGLDERRLRLEAAGITFDLRAEKSPSGWDFVGRLSGPLAESEKFAAHIGSKKIECGSAEFYQWSSAYPPRRLVLQSHDTKITFPELSWKKPEKQ